MRSLKQDRTILDDNFCKKFQQISLVQRSLHMFEELGDIWDEDDDLLIEYDESVNLHVILHYSYKFNETRPICYINQDNFSMKKFHQFIIPALKEQWAEYAI